MSFNVKNTIFINQFGGYNQLPVIAANEWADMQNITHDYYPILATRQGRSYVDTISGTIYGMHVYKQDTAMVVAANGNLYTGVTTSSTGAYAGDLASSTKQFATNGTRTLIMPDAVVYDDSDGSLTSVNRSFRSASYTSGTVTETVLMKVYLCDLEGNTPTGYTCLSDPPDDTDYWWWDPATETVKAYSTSLGVWIPITYYYKLSPVIMHTTSTAGYEVDYDDATVSSAKALYTSFNNYLGTLSAYDVVDILLSSSSVASYTYDDLTSKVVYNSGSEDDVNYIVISPEGFDILGVWQNVYCYIGTKCPDLDFVVALNNRWWGVSNDTHEIFASALGDPYHWYTYIGLSTDSWTASLGHDEEITAAAIYGSYVHFFTENKIIKVYGTTPSTFQLNVNEADGVLTGADRTVKNVYGILFYVSRNGVMAYDGSFPTTVSQNFVPYYFLDKDCIGGRDGFKYMLSCDEDIFVYDTTKGLWTVHEGTSVQAACELEGAFCYIDSSGNYWTYANRDLEGYDNSTSNTSIGWTLKSGVLGLDSPYQHYITRLQLRFDLAGPCTIQIAYDTQTGSSSEFTTVWDQDAADVAEWKSYTVPIRVRRCDHFQIKMTGYGQIKLYSVGYIQEEGSEKC